MIVNVRVTPNSGGERFERTGDGEFTASIKERAQRDESNDHVQRLVAGYFNVPLTFVRFLTGIRAKKKVFEVAMPAK